MMRVKALSAEARLILACCGAGSEASESEAALRDPALDWRCVIDLALIEGVMPSVYRRLAANFSDRVPEPAMRELRFHYQGNALRNRSMTRDLVRLIALLESRDIAPIAFKGPTLTQVGFGDLAMRQFSDLDLLVRRDEMPATIALLAAEGFSPQASNPEIVIDDFFQASEDAFIKPGAMAAIDVHWNLMPRYFPFAPDAESVRRRAVRLRFEEGEVTTLAPRDHLLLACVHGTKHGWPSLGAIADVAALLRIEEAWDWPALREEAAARSSLTMLLLGAMLARRALAAPLPEPMLERARRDPTVAALVPRLLGALFSGREGARVPFFNDWIVPLRAIARPRARLAYVLDRALAPTFDDWKFAPLAAQFFPLYYLLRPIRILIQQTPRLGAALGRRASPEARP